MNLRQIAKKAQAIAALFALLLTSVAGLAESVSAANLPGCCSTVYCPLHQRQVHEVQKDKSNCDGQGNPMRDSSMRACDTTPPPVVGTAPYVLLTPLAVRYVASTEPTQIQESQFVPFVASIPLTPPPRTLPS